MLGIPRLRRNIVRLLTIWRRQQHEHELLSAEKIKADEEKGHVAAASAAASDKRSSGSSVAFRVFQGAVMALFANMVGQYLVARRDRKLKKFHLQVVPIVQFVLWTIAITPVLIRWQDILDYYFPSQITCTSSVSQSRQISHASPSPSSSSLSLSVDLEKRATPSPRIVRTVKYSQKNIVIKTILSETFFAFVSNAIFLFYMAYLRDHSTTKAVAAVERDLMQVWTNSIKFWPLISYVTLGFIPVDYRIAFSSVFAAIWSVYVSMVTL
ncbi:hypothetical protein BZA70DRAFT_289371 [Myxozyma melibiosi]|uniref:Uncharacterized protein n=1 Tax=Myxozyma melibiosi TaxID=54550 RepID=A0ABR1F6H9_9ASCO